MFTNADFTGTQRTYLLMEKDEQLVRASGVWRWFATNVFGAVVHQIDALTSVAHLGSKERPHEHQDLRVQGQRRGANRGYVGRGGSGVGLGWGVASVYGTPGTWT
ncbi:hypothetical protein GCM10023170_092300 [Phytohabitans houttuyneae]|uniref:Uncharacterized protein n=1 Tax=Phytohabitans houttuyneae TaxID=1076126 RepID=A0A6V8K6E7_9ACTN|nr:hypothetical protein Phou_015070 [Phytohabitans houttuyneae]